MAQTAAMRSEKKTKKCGVPFLAGTLAVLFILTVLLWGVSSGWGSISIKRTYLFADNGDKVSVISYIPDTATNENPAPVVLNFHGRANSAHTLDAWSLEQARRGYVVLNVDRSGAGESVFTSGENEAIYQYAMTLTFVDTEQVVVAGFSSGMGPVTELAAAHDNVVAAIHVFPPFIRESNGNLPTNHMLIKAGSDQYNFEETGPRDVYEQGVAAFLGLDGEVTPGEIYGSFEDGTAKEYVFVPRALHQTAGVSKGAITAMLSFMEQATDTPNPIDPASHIYWWAQFLALACCVTMVVFAMALGATLLKHPFFAEIVQPMPENRGKRGWKLALNILIAIGIPICTFIPFSTFGMDVLAKNAIFPAKNFNGIWVWLMLNTLITLAIMAFGYLREKKAGEVVSLSHYALAPEGESRLNGRRILKSLVLALCVASIFYLWLQWIDGFFGIGYQFMTLAAFTEVSPERLAKAWSYILVLFCVLFVGAIGMNTSRRLKETGDPRKDMAKAIALNALIAAAAVGLLLLSNYGIMILRGEGNGIFHFAEGQSSVGALNFAFAFPFLMGSMGAINTYYFRKTGTIWTGVFLTALIAGITAFVAQPLVM